MKDKIIVDAIIESLNNNAEDWSISLSKCVYENNKTGIGIWVENIPIVNTTIYYPIEYKPNLISRIRLYRAIKNSKKIKIYNALTTKK